MFRTCVAPTVLLLTILAACGSGTKKGSTTTAGPLSCADPRATGDAERFAIVTKNEWCVATPHEGTVVKARITFGTGGQIGFHTTQVDTGGTEKEVSNIKTCWKLEGTKISAQEGDSFIPVPVEPVTGADGRIELDAGSAVAHYHACP